jgi:hypothetical protein
VLAPILAYFQLVWSASVDVPFLDDWDALLGFLTHWIEEDGWRGRLRRLFAPHNEHVLATPRATVLLVHGIRGHLDFTVLNLVGNGYLLLLLTVLFAVFRAPEPASSRLLAFAPAVLFLVQPQSWTTVITPTAVLSNPGVVALAAVSFLALARGTPAAVAGAALPALAATFSQGNGFLVLPLGVLVLALHGHRRTALAWGGLTLVALLVYFVLLDPPGQRTSPFASLDRPDRLLRYALNLVGCAGGFSQRGVSLAVGALVTGSFVALWWRGLPRRNPVLFALFLFLFASIAANALVRAHQGPGAPLFQPRYRFFSAVLLALTHLGWAELLHGRTARRWLTGAIAASLAFSAVSFRIGRAEVVELSQELSAGLEHWWSTGEGGLRHPDFRKASFFLNAALDAELLRVPRDWAARFAAQPERREVPPAGDAVSLGFQAIYQDESVLLVSGWAVAGPSAVGQEVEIVLASENGTLFFPALEVLRVDLPQHSERAARRMAPAGFHALIAKRALAAGVYRLGVLVRRDGAEYLSYRQAPLVIFPGP